MNGWQKPAICLAVGAYVVAAVWWTASLSADVRQNKLTSTSQSSHSLRIGILEDRWQRIDDLLAEIRKDVKALGSR